MKKTGKHVSEIPAMDDEDLKWFWEAHGPEDFEGWTEGGTGVYSPGQTADSVAA